MCKDFAHMQGVLIHLNVATLVFCNTMRRRCECSISCESQSDLTNTGFCLVIQHLHHHFTLKAPAIVTQQLLTRDK